MGPYLNRVEEHKRYVHGQLFFAEDVVLSLV